MQLASKRNLLHNQPPPWLLWLISDFIARTKILLIPILIVYTTDIMGNRRIDD